MTQKELLYVEDAIGHEKTIVSVLNDTIEKLENEDLVSYMNDEVATHQEIMDDLTKLLEGNCNE